MLWERLESRSRLKPLIQFAENHGGHSVGRAGAGGYGACDRIFDSLRFLGEAQAVPQEHRDARNHCTGIRDSLSGNVGRGTVNGFVKAARRFAMRTCFSSGSDPRRLAGAFKHRYDIRHCIIYRSQNRNRPRSGCHFLCSRKAFLFLVLSVVW